MKVSILDLRIEGLNVARQIKVEIDDEQLAQVQSILGTRTVRETIEAAFREVIRSQARREEVRALTTMEGMDLAETIGTTV